jgi:hypothetical protein
MAWNGGEGGKLAQSFKTNDLTVFSIMRFVALCSGGLKGVSVRIAVYPSAFGHDAPKGAYPKLRDQPSHPRIEATGINRCLISNRAPSGKGRQHACLSNTAISVTKFPPRLGQDKFYPINNRMISRNIRRIFSFLHRRIPAFEPRVLIQKNSMNHNRQAVILQLVG